LEYVFKEFDMKKIISRVLFGIALVVLTTTCNNPFFPGKSGGKAPVISLEDSNLSDTYCVKDEEITLTVGVEGDEDDFTYQWYSNTENSNEGGTSIYGATEPGFDPPTNEVGTTYYYVVITNKRNGKTTKSDPVKVTVYPAGTPVETIREIANNMVQIPAGTFMMGSPATEPDRIEAREEQHQVMLTKNFKMSKYQVTQKQYRVVMGTLPSSLPSSSYGVGDNYPVYYVSWYDAIVFCNKLSVMEGLSPVYSINSSTNPDDWGAVPTSSNAIWNEVTMVSGANGYRLPTEAEWEYACRGNYANKATETNTKPFGIGDGTKMISGMANFDVGYPYDLAHSPAGAYDDTSAIGYLGKTTMVGNYQANNYGLYDMHGNVYEWCWDWFKADITMDTNDPTGAVTGTVRVLRGGSWIFDAQSLRSAIRGSRNPDFRNHYIGFRLVRSN
jgi:formylglycine-generating enzyme required for sulfatase activity